MKKKILVLTSTFPRWKNDTTPSFISELAIHFSLLQLETMVLAPHHAGARIQETSKGIRIYRFPYLFPFSWQHLAYEGGILPNLKRSKIAKIQIPFFLLSELFASFFLSIKNNVDIINSHWIIPQGFIGALIKKMGKVKIHIVTVHAGDLSLLERLPLKEKVLTFIMNNSTYIIVVSSYGRNKLIKLTPLKLRKRFEAKIKVIPMGVYTKDFVCHSKKNVLLPPKEILFVGRLAEKKGVFYLLNAMPIIIKKIPNVTLRIVGDGPLEKDLKVLTKKLKIENSVNFVGFQTGEDKIQSLIHTDLLVVPSIQTNEGDEEGLPVVIMEGMSAGKPIVGSKCGGIPEMIHDGENGLLVEQKSSDQLAEKIIYLFQNPHILRNMGEKSFFMSKKYDWQKIIQQYNELIN